MEGAAQDIFHILQDLLDLPAIGLFGVQHQFGQGLIWLKALQIFHQLIGVAQRVHRPGLRLFPLHAGIHQIGVAAEQVFRQFLNQLGLGNAFRCGTQALRHNFF